MLAAEAALNRPAFDTLDAPTARRMVSEQPSPPGQAVAAVKTLAIPRDDGEAMPARVYAPDGNSGPAFLIFPNFDVLMRWNSSGYFATGVAQLAQRVTGAE